MMRVIDTSAWIEWLVGSPLGKKLTREIPDKSECVVPTIVQLELAKWLAREVGEDQADQMIACTQKSAWWRGLTRAVRCPPPSCIANTSWQPPMPWCTQRPASLTPSCLPAMHVLQVCLAS